MTITAQRLCIDISSLPDISEVEMNFYDTSFFLDSSRKLPSPAEVLQHKRSGTGRGIVRFEEHYLAVKFGPSAEVRLEEAQTMRAVRQACLPGEVPVPEVFGWRQYEGQNFIYMGLVDGETLREVWPSLIDDDKQNICARLKCIVRCLQKITTGEPSFLIGSVNGGKLQDRFFKPDFEAGPFSSIRSFNDWFFCTAVRQRTLPESFEGSYRDFLPDNGKVYFTHGDLTLGNIMVAGDPGSKDIVGIIDWEQAGWYPEYWEYCKLLYGVEYSHEWRAEGWAEQVMAAFPEEWIAFAEYSLWRCP